MRAVAFLLLGLRLAFAEPDTLQYFYTVVSENIAFPEFTAVGMINDQQFMYFDSNTRKVVPKTEWINADDWDTQTQTVIGHYQGYKNNMVLIIERFNHSTSGVHTVQLMYGCELEDDRNSQGYWQIGYDAEDFLGLDLSTRTWTPANPEAVISKNKWEASGADANFWKAYLEDECIDWLKKYVSYGKDTLERKVPPEVSLLQKDPSSPVMCHATSFYPSNIIMTWMKNHEDYYEDVWISSTLPNADGTFQKSISLSVKPEEWKKNTDVYRCVIQHVGAGREIVLLLNDKNIKSNSAPDILIAVGCSVVLITLAFIISFFACKKNSTGEATDNDGQLQTDSSDSQLLEPVKMNCCQEPKCLGDCKPNM